MIEYKLSYLHYKPKSRIIERLNIVINRLMVTLMIDESENYYKIDNVFNVTEEKNIS